VRQSSPRALTWHVGSGHTKPSPPQCLIPSKLQAGIHAQYTLTSWKPIFVLSSLTPRVFQVASGGFKYSRCRASVAPAGTGGRGAGMPGNMSCIEWQ
jgi:hypothetical protein